MHIADGVLSTPVVASGIAGTGALAAYAAAKTKTEELPKISLLAGAFFIISLVSLPLPGPTCVHPMLAAFLGIMLGSKAVIAVLVGLGLQAVLLQYGGITTLGINTLLVTLPAVAGGQIFYYSRNISSIFKRGFISGALATMLSAAFLALIMYFSDERYAEGFFSLVNMILITHLVLAVAVEAPITGFALRHLQKARPALLTKFRSEVD